MSIAYYFEFVLLYKLIRVMYNMFSLLILIRYIENGIVST